MAGSYWKGDVIICGACGEEIKDPYPAGGQWIYPEKPKAGFISKLVWALGFAERVYEPSWGEAVSGRAPQKIIEEIRRKHKY